MKKLYRSRKDRILSGVCGGLAEYFQIDPVIVRIIFVVAAFIKGIGVLVYLAGLIIIPNNPQEGEESDSVTPISRAKDSYFWGILAVIAGVILLINENHWYHFHIYDLDFTLLLGISLIAAGIYMIYHFSRTPSETMGAFTENLEATGKKMMSNVKLYKKSSEKIISGVCAGLADYFKIDVSMVRIGTVILAILTKGILVVAYILAIFILPDYKEESEIESDAASSAAVINEKNEKDKGTKKADNKNAKSKK